MKKYTRCIQMYTMRASTKTKEDLLVTLDKIAAMGYDGVQITVPAFMTAAELRKELDVRGLFADSVFMPTASVKGSLTEAVKVGEALGTQAVRTDGMPHNLMKTVDGFKSYAETLSEAADLLAGCGLKFMYHNHYFEFVNFEGCTGMDILLGETSRNVMFQPDVHHIAYAGFEPSSYLYKFNGRAEYIHMQEYAVLPDLNKESIGYTVPVGKGNLNWKGIVKAAVDIGVHNFVVEHDDCLTDPFEEIKYSLAAVDRLLEGANN